MRLLTFRKMSFEFVQIMDSSKKASICHNTLDFTHYKWNWLVVVDVGGNIITTIAVGIITQNSKSPNAIEQTSSHKKRRQ